MQAVFVTGGTGYIGSRLVKELLVLNYQVYALVRLGSEHKLPKGCTIVYGNALDAASYQQSIPKGCTFVHLIGVAHPSPAKKQQFMDIDLCSIQEAVKAATVAGVKHFVYLSVAQLPSGIMQSYQNVRATGEELIREKGFDATFVRPWYVVGPGHYWPLIIKPLFPILKLFPSTRQKAIEFDLVSIKQIITALTQAITNPPSGIRVITVADIKQTKKSQGFSRQQSLILN